MLYCVRVIQYNGQHKCPVCHVTVSGLGICLVQTRLEGGVFVAGRWCGPTFVETVIICIFIYLFWTMQIWTESIVCWIIFSLCHMVYTVTYLWMCDYRRGMDRILDLLTTCTHHPEVQVITALSLISTLYKPPQHALNLFQPAVSSSVVPYQQPLTVGILQLVALRPSCPCR
jgi:hypothetical protein